MTHARLSASGAKKWLNCPLSVTLEEKIPNISSPYAEEGTKAHEEAERTLKNALYLQKTYSGDRLWRTCDVRTDEEYEREKYIDQYINYVLERYNQYTNAAIEIEKRVDFSPWVPSGFGTSDVIILTGDVIEIIDLKYGKGVRVEVENNPQLMLYALGALNDYSAIIEPKKVIMSIVQPRLDHISRWEISVDDLLAWGEKIKPKALKAHKGEGECVVGTHCDEGFCRARPICRAYANKQLEIAKMDFADPPELSNAEITEILSKVDTVAKWCKDIKDYALSQALQGVKYEGYKLVEGRKTRSYTVDERKIAWVLQQHKYTNEAIYDIELKSIAKLEKSIGKEKVKEILGEYITKPSGKPTLVSINDERPEYNSALNDFENM